VSPNHHRLNPKDILFGAVNGAIFGLMSPFILKSFDFLPASEFLFFFGFSALAAVGIAVGILLSRISETFFQLAKFGCVGAANFAIDLGVMNLLIFTTGITNGIIVDLFKAVSFSVAVTNSYFWNKHWSFSNRNVSNPEKEFSQFFFISVAGACINVGIASFFTNFIGPQGGISAAAWPNIGAGVGAIAVLAWNFLGYKFIVFRQAK
jgi:putative flippase GtrA